MGVASAVYWSSVWSGDDLKIVKTQFDANGFT
jgi:hypothetical protein